MNKHATKILGLGALCALVIAGCTPSVKPVATHMGADDASEIGIFTDSNGVRNDAVDLSAPLSVSAFSPTAISVYNTTGQLVYLDFNYLVDSATAASGISFYSIADNVLTDYDSLSTLSAISAGAPTVVSDGGQGCRVYFTLNLSTSYSRALVLVKADVLTAQGGAVKLDGNGNKVWGEATLDDWREAFDVYQNSGTGSSAPPATVTELVADPSALLPYTPSTTLSGGIFDFDTFGDSADLNLTFTTADTGAPQAPTLNNRITVDPDCATVYKMQNGAWTVIQASTTYTPATYTATVALPASPLPGEAYKVVVNKYKIYESQAIRGSVHRASYDQANLTGTRDAVSYVYFDRGYGSTQRVWAFPGGDPNAAYIDIDVGRGTPFDMSTINAATFKIALSGARLGTDSDNLVSAGEYYLPEYSIQPLYTGSFDLIDTAVYAFRVYLPANIYDYQEGAVLISPSVISLDVANPVSGAGVGKRHFADPSNAAADGWTVHPFDTMN